MLIRLALLTVAASLAFVDGVRPASTTQVDDLTVGSTVVQLPAPPEKAATASRETVVTGTVTSGPRPPGRIVVELWTRRGALVARALTDRSGHFRFEGVQPGGVRDLRTSSRLSVDVLGRK